MSFIILPSPHIDNCRVEQCSQAYMPYDPEGAHDAILHPQETARLFGWLYLTNNTLLEVEAHMEFRLYTGGLYIKITSKTLEGEPLVLEQYVPMNSALSLEVQDGKLCLIPTPENTQQETSSKNLKKLTMLSQKG